MLDECLISILQYLIDNSYTPDLSVLSSYIDIVEIILDYHHNDTIALNAKHCLIEQLNIILEEMNKEETMQ